MRSEFDRGLKSLQRGKAVEIYEIPAEVLEAIREVDEVTVFQLICMIYEIVDILYLQTCKRV